MMTRLGSGCALLVCLFWPLVAPAAIETTITVEATQTVHFGTQTAKSLEDAVPPGFGSGSPASHHNFHLDAFHPETLPGYVDLTGFTGTLTLTATGEWNSGNDGSAASGPGGNGDSVIPFGTYTSFGVSQIIADMNTLVGVFTSDEGPSILSMPDILNALTDDMHNPQLNQTFVIGDGIEGLIVPDGATKLYLGRQDTHAWNTATGSVEVQVEGFDVVTFNVDPVPAPGSLLVMGLFGLSGLAWKKWRSPAQAASI